MFINVLEYTIVNKTLEILKFLQLKFVTRDNHPSLKDKKSFNMRGNSVRSLVGDNGSIV